MFSRMLLDLTVTTTFVVVVATVVFDMFPRGSTDIPFRGGLPVGIVIAVLGLIITTPFRKRDRGR